MGRDLGHWGGVARQLADQDPERADALLDWRLADLLAHAHLRLTRMTADAHRFDLLYWALTAPHVKDPPKCPETPALLKD